MKKSKKIIPQPTPQEVTPLCVSWCVSTPLFFSAEGRFLLPATDPWCSVIAEQFRDDLKYIIHGHIFYPWSPEVSEAWLSPGKNFNLDTGGDSILGA